MTPPAGEPDDPFAEPEVTPGWATGTAIDEFTGVYVAFARATARHGALAPAEVDALDLSAAAALLGVGEDPYDEGDYTTAAAELARERMAAAARGESYSWDNGHDPSL